MRARGCLACLVGIVCLVGLLWALLWPTPPDLVGKGWIAVRAEFSGYDGGPPALSASSTGRTLIEELAVVIRSAGFMWPP